MERVEVVDSQGHPHQGRFLTAVIETRAYFNDAVPDDQQANAIVYERDAAGHVLEAVASNRAGQPVWRFHVLEWPTRGYFKPVAQIVERRARPAISRLTESEALKSQPLAATPLDADAELRKKRKPITVNPRRAPTRTETRAMTIRQTTASRNPVIDRRPPVRIRTTTHVPWRAKKHIARSQRRKATTFPMKTPCRASLPPRRRLRLG